MQIPDAEIYDAWNAEKKYLARTDKEVLFKHAEVWWCSLGHNIGTEILGKGDKFMRPVLILKRLNAHSCICLPLSSKQKAGSWYVSIGEYNQSRSVILSQIRTLHVNRFQRRIYTIRPAEFLKVKEKLRELLELF